MTGTIGIIGLGRTGMPAAEAYMKAGYKVYGYDIHGQALDRFRGLGGISCESPEDTARQTPILLIFVLNDRQVEEVISGENGILKGMKEGSVVVCMSTINRTVLEKQARYCLSKNLQFVDCPFTGGPARIPGGNLTLIAAAPDETIDRARPVLEVIGRLTRAGREPGLGQAIKHCNQLLVGVTHTATMEVITMARRLGLDASLVSRVVGSGIAGSDYFRLLSEAVLEKKPSPGGLGQMCKDVSIVVNTARQAEMPAHTIRGASVYFNMAEEGGMADLEGADLIELVEKPDVN
jgi:3-hydroxyisobutyrate dehydrogenase-like beta-hydroxyacid dehydrogenase